MHRVRIASSIWLAVLLNAIRCRVAFSGAAQATEFEIAVHKLRGRPNLVHCHRKSVIPRWFDGVGNTGRDWKRRGHIEDVQSLPRSASPTALWQPDFGRDMSNNPREIAFVGAPL